MSEAYYCVRYLPDKGVGAGEIVAVVGCEAEASLDMLAARYPSDFERPGFYSLMRATGETLTVKEPQP